MPRAHTRVRAGWCGQAPTTQRFTGNTVPLPYASHAVPGNTASITLTVRQTRASCDSALEINTSVKGLYRRSQAFYYQRLFDEALRDCQAAVAMDTKNNKGIAAFLVTVQKQVDEQSKKEKAFYGKMFG